jgi:hypothetical protein
VRDLKQDELSLTQARLLSNFALGAAKDENWPLATQRLREAIQICGECSALAGLRKNLGLVLAQSGDTNAAVDELRIARELDPQDRDTEYALRVLTQSRRDAEPAVTTPSPSCLLTEPRGVSERRFTS